ncbi:hypothetical protein KYT87_13680 [Achromobacter sp. ES-001]|uniref:hypothetical protein n=1 Tax=Achromobacter sp. ES-001 TaxID=2860286 RepID=UPI001C63FF8C|nr:hypothetical protein [Achromobacter sp. ES-001]QYJ24174.1 hypothetical protein KYT87_13680 [Achromobacter sp. ES-001]
MSTKATLQGKTGQTESEALSLIKQENDWLFSQLHIVQEALERLHRGEGFSLSGASVKPTADDAELQYLAADHIRCIQLLKSQKDIYSQVSQHTLASRLGNILLHGLSRWSSFLSLPRKLWELWQETRGQTQIKKLGGKNFEAVILAFKQGGLEAVESLLASVSSGPATRANALTVLARSFLGQDPSMVAELARQAYEVDPRYFRLKWLAFRLHEAGELIEAEAILDIAVEEIQFSESESRQAERLRSEAKRVRVRQALQMHSFFERQKEIIGQVRSLSKSHGEQVALLKQQRLDIDDLRTLVAEREREVERLKKHAEDSTTEGAQRNSSLVERGSEHANSGSDTAHLEFSHVQIKRDHIGAV